MSGVFQIRRGPSSSRPNPLNIGEFGWDTDTNQLWIGNGVSNQNLFVAGALATTDFSIYVAAPALGGRPSAAGADGLKMVSGTATATTTNKLVDGAAVFDSTHLNKTVYNSSADKWAKVTAVDSATQLTLSADIMVSGNAYEIANAFDNVPEAWSAIPSPFGANITLRNSSGTFSDVINIIGKTPVGTKTITWQGDATGAGTTISGATTLNNAITVNNINFTGTVDTSAVLTISTCTFADVLTCGYGTLLTWTNCTVSKKIVTNNGADLTWDNCNTSGTAKLFIQLGSKNLIQNSTVTVGNDPTNITNISSTITTGYTMYVATSALGGDDTVADGLEMASGSATSTTANKLVDSGANFTSDMLNKTVWNSTNDTWAKITAVDSATQLSLSVDIMTSGDSYVVANAFSTRQAAINAIPGSYNANTTIKISSGTWTEANTLIQGKKATGTFGITIKGTLPTPDDTGTVTSVNGYSMGAAGSGAIQAAISDSTKAWTTNQHQNKLLVLTGGTGAGDEYIIDSSTATVLTIAGVWYTQPDTTTTYAIYDLGLGTNLDLSSLAGLEQHFELNGQIGVTLRHLKFKDWHGLYSVYVHDFSAISIYGCSFERGRTDAGSDACLQVESYATLPVIDATVFNHTGGAVTRAIRLQQAGAAIQGVNMHNIKTWGFIDSIVIAASSFQNWSPSGHGWVIRNPSAHGLNLNSFSRADLVSCILTGAGTNNVIVADFGMLILRTDCEISSATSDGIILNGYGDLVNFWTSTQINSNGGWGINATNHSFGKNVSIYSYAGNTSGTYTADTSSITT